jgi:hypothetical protein
MHVQRVHQTWWGQWLIPVVLATRESETDRIQVQGPPGQIFLKTHIQQTQSKMDWRYAASVRMLALPVPKAEFKQLPLPPP